MTTTGNTRNYLLDNRSWSRKIDFANLILLLVWRGCIEIGIGLLWFMLFDMLVLFVKCIWLLQLESALKKVVCRNVLSKLDCFFVIYRGGTGFRNLFVCLLFDRKHLFLDRSDWKELIFYFVVMIREEQYKHEVYLGE